MAKKENKGKYSRKKAAKPILSVLGIILCLIFSITLLCNLAIIVKGTLFPDRPPSVLGITPMVVLSGSMSGDQEGHIEIGDLVFIGKADPEELQVGDVIAYMDGKVVVTHRIIDVETEKNGIIYWQTKGDANNAADTLQIHQDQLVGIYKGRIPMVGNVVLFMQEPLGMVIFIGLPVLGYLAYDMLLRQNRSNRDKKKQREMEAEIARLRALAGEDISR